MFHVSTNAFLDRNPAKGTGYFAGQGIITIRAATRFPSTPNQHLIDEIALLTIYPQSVLTGEKFPAEEIDITDKGNDRYGQHASVMFCRVLKFLLLDFDNLILVQSDNSKKTPADRYNEAANRGMSLSSLPKETPDKVISL